jgi:iron complex transport system substrate-binding protein
MAPNITETVFTLGRGDKLVAVSDFCIFPQETKSLPKIGGFFNPNLERLAALRPDLILLQGEHEKVDRFARSRGIRVVHVNMDSLQTIYSGIEKLGTILEAPEAARALCLSIKERLHKFRGKALEFRRKKVFVSLGRAMGSMANLYTIGGPSFLSEVLAIAGGDNIFGDVTQPYPEASKESLIKRAPDVILEIRPGEIISQEQRDRIISEWRVFKKIPAVTHGHIRVITEDYVLIPGPRIGDVAQILMDALHEEP